MNKLRKSLRACAHILLWVLIAWHLFWPILLGSARYSAPAVTSLYTALAGCVNWLGLYSLSLALGLLLGGWAMHIVTDVLGFNSKVAGHPIPKEKVDVKFARETQACVREVTPPTGPGWVMLEEDWQLVQKVMAMGDTAPDVGRTIRHALQAYEVQMLARDARLEEARAMSADPAKHDKV